MPENHPIEPLPLEAVVDNHVHCDYSIDAEGTVDDYCHAALRRNLAEICFTTHFDANPRSDGRANFIRVAGELKPTTIDSLAPYVEDVRAAAENFYSLGLSVRLGVEFGWYTGCEEMALRLKEAYPFDYYLCGIHEIDDICFCSRGTYRDCFASHTPESLARGYFVQVADAARSRLFDTIAHLGYHVRYGAGHFGPELLTCSETIAEEIYPVLVASGAALEINTSGIRHGLKDYFPWASLLNRAKRAGVEVRCLGSDAHHPTQIGFDFEAATALVPSGIRICED